MAPGAGAGVQLNVRVREAARADAATVAALLTELGYPTSAGEAARRLARDGGERVLVAEDVDGPERAAAHCLYESAGYERTSHRIWRPLPTP